jgi:cytochrome c peroxidase
VRENAETSVRAGIQHSLFREVDESTANALDAYLSQLRPLPSPHLKNKNPELVEKGRKLFSERNCTDCHSGPYLTNQKSYDLGTGKGAETGKPIDVPTLREIWRTAPYLHDGRAATIEAAITELNRNAEFHEQCGVRDDEVGALAAYLKTL